MRIAWISPYDVMSLADRMDQDFPKPFHPATWLRNGALALVEKPDIELHVLSYDKRFLRDYHFTDRRIHFHFFHVAVPQIPRPIALYQIDRWKFYGALKEINPDVVHGHGTENLFSYVAVTSGYPHVISIQSIISHMIWQYRRISRRALEHFIVQFIERYTIRRAQNFIIKAPFAESFVRRLNPTAPVHLLENIVNDAFFGVRRRPASARRRIVFVGVLINIKGVEELIKAFNQVAPDYPDIELHLFGTGTPAYVNGVLRPLSRPYADRIIFRGQVPSEQIAREFEDASAVVLASYNDMSPNVLAEAMVAGVPVIGSDVDGIPFMITHDRTGQIVPMHNVEKLAAAVRRYLDDPRLAERYSAAAQEEARRRYGKERYVETLLDIYRSAIKNAPAGWPNRREKHHSSGN